MTDVTTEPADQAADSYGVVVPDTWINVPLDPGGFDEIASRLRHQLADMDGWDKAAERRLDVLVSQLKNDLVTNRVRLAAVWAETGEGDGGETGLLLVGLSVSKLLAEELVPAGLLVTPERLAAGLSRTSTGPEDGHDRRERISNIEAPTVVTLEHAGEAVRLKRVYERTLNVLDTLRFYAQSYLVPHDGGESICVLQFSTPNVEDASLLDELFEAIAQTLRIFRPGDPTDFGESLVDMSDG